MPPASSRLISPCSSAQEASMTPECLIFREKVFAESPSRSASSYGWASFALVLWASSEVAHQAPRSTRSLVPQDAVAYSKAQCPIIGLQRKVKISHQLVADMQCAKGAHSTLKPNTSTLHIDVSLSAPPHSSQKSDLTCNIHSSSHEQGDLLLCYTHRPYL